MRFTYQYKTRDGVAHAGVYSASSRTAVYDELRAKGIKPFGVELAPGAWNRIAGFLGWRGALIVFLVVLSGLSVLWGVRRIDRTAEAISVDDAIFDSRTRRQVVGDIAVIEEGLGNGWASIFDLAGERFLASFAVPGVPASVRTTTEKELLQALDANPRARRDESIEARQIRAMVEGMKDELRAYLAAGGTVKQYGERLVARQEAELNYYRGVEAQVKAAVKANANGEELTAVWKRGNDELRRMGIRLVPRPAEDAE